MMGKAIYSGSNVFCPVSTSSPIASGDDHEPELRAYKLGKQKCSFNQVELIVNDVGNGRITRMRISHAVESPVGLEVDELLRESCLKFNVGFMNNKRMYLYVYLVYASPHRMSHNGNHSLSSPPAYHWIPVTRGKCRKGCKGPVIRGLQRFGRMPRRKAEGSSSSDEDSWKQPHHLYIAIDEASGHHNASNFRLLLAAYGERNELLGTTVSNSIRVFANNDAPLGPACFDIHFSINGGWGASESPIGSGTYDKYVNCRPPLQEILRNSTTNDASKNVESSMSQQDSLLDSHCQLDLNKPGDSSALSTDEDAGDNNLTDENVDVNPKFFAPRRKRGYKPFREHASHEAAAACWSNFPQRDSTDFIQGRENIGSELEQTISHRQSGSSPDTSESPIGDEPYHKFLICRPPLQEIGSNSKFMTDMTKHIEGSSRQQYSPLDCQLDLNKPIFDYEKADSTSISAQDATCADTFADENMDVNTKCFAPRKKRGYMPFREQFSRTEPAAACEPLLHSFPVFFRRSQSTSTHYGQTSRLLEQPVSFEQSDHEIPDESSDEAVAVDVLKNWLIAASSSSSSGHPSDCCIHMTSRSPAHDVRSRMPPADYGASYGRCLLDYRMGSKAAI